MELQKWQKYNSQFRSKCLLKVGDIGGFFSEYNNMLVAIQWCMVHKVRFIMTSKGANFGYKSGWTDYFLPFCDEWNLPLDRKYFNDRRYYKLYPNAKDRRKAKILHLFLGWWYNLRCKVLHIDYFTRNLFDIFRLQPVNDIYTVEGLNLKGTIPEICTELDKIIWRYNPETEAEVRKRMPLREMECEPYVSIHVRRGDKYTEMDDVDVETYMSTLEQKTNLRRCFVATDDYRVYEHLAEKYPEWSFFTIAKKEDLGFDVNSFNQQNADKTRQDMYELFATIETMAKGEYFVGTMGSNIGMYMYFRMPKGRCFGVDYNDWRIF